MGYSVLLVIGSPDMRKLLRLAVENAGHTADEMTNGEEALEYLANHVPDVLVTDVPTMAWREGFVLEHVRNTPALQEKGIIVLASFPIPQEEREGLPFDRLLVSPITIDELLGAIEELAGAGP